MGSMFQHGDSVRVVNPKAKSYGVVGQVKGYTPDSKIKVSISSKVQRELGMPYNTMIFNQSSLEKKEEHKPKPTASQEYLLAKINQHQIHCDAHPNDFESHQHLKQMKQKLGDTSIQDIKKSLAPDNEIFYALYRTSSRFEGYQQVICGTAQSTEDAKSKIEHKMLSLEADRDPDVEYHVVIRKLPIPVKFEYTMVKIED